VPPIMNGAPPIDVLVGDEVHESVVTALIEVCLTKCTSSGL
jgi:hypothetical protein